MSPIAPWLYVIGIGEEGIDSLSPAARALIDSAQVIVGGERHLAKVPQGKAERLTWSGGLSHAVEEISKRSGKRVAVLASGDPFDYGIGAVLVRHFEAREMTVVPVPGAFSLACARMGWSRPDVETITLHGRPLERLNLFLAPGARLLILSRDGDTPGLVGALLEGRGFGESPMTVLERMGGPDERRIDGVAQSWDHPRCADLNTIAVECVAGANALCLPRVPGLPEEAFEHDGKITKREVRAATLARLMPLGGQVLWDVGAGSGSIAIEWMRASRTAQAIAVEGRADGCAVIARNALALGVPGLQVVEGRAPQVLEDIGEKPDAVFVGGGIASNPDILEACHGKLEGGGRLVANAVTMEAEERLLAFRNNHGGEMSRIAVSRAGPVGSLTAFRPLMTVTQYWLVKE